jgi:hypothetical protein
MPALVVHTCDKYKFCWDYWYYYFNKYFTLDWPVYFMNEVIDINFDPINVIQVKTGSGSWSSRLKNGLKQIDETYILYMQEDMWLTSLIDKSMFKFSLDLCEQLALNKFIICGLSKDELINHRELTEFTFNKYSVYKIKNKAPCIMSHQPAIWNKNFLQSILPEGEDPWTNEVRGTIRLNSCKDDLKFYQLVLNDNCDCVWYSSVHRARTGFTLVGKQMILEASRSDFK